MFFCFPVSRVFVHPTIACGCCCGGAYRGGGRHPHLQPSTGWEKTTWWRWSGWKELRITLCLTVLLKTDTEVIWSTPKSVSQLHFQWSSFRCVSFPNWSKVVSTNCRKCSFFSLPWTLSHPKHPESGLPYQFRSTNVALQQKHHFDATHAVVSWWRTILTLQAETFVCFFEFDSSTYNEWVWTQNYELYKLCKIKNSMDILYLRCFFFGHKCGGKLNVDRILIHRYIFLNS